VFLLEFWELGVALGSVCLGYKWERGVGFQVCLGFALQRAAFFEGCCIITTVLEMEKSVDLRKGLELEMAIQRAQIHEQSLDSLKPS
jgi:hypothetical protein